MYLDTSEHLHIQLQWIYIDNAFSISMCIKMKNNAKIQYMSSNFINF